MTRALENENAGGEAATSSTGGSEFVRLDRARAEPIPPTLTLAIVFCFVALSAAQAFLEIRDHRRPVRPVEFDCDRWTCRTADEERRR